MPRIMLQNKMMLNQSSRSSFGSSRRSSSSSWSYRSSLDAGGAIEVKMALASLAMGRRQSLERRSQRDSLRAAAEAERRDDSASSEGPDDWGFFVDIGNQVEEREVERTFLNVFNPTTRRSSSSKLVPIADSGF